jgi:hypothetical protein
LRKFKELTQDRANMANTYLETPVAMNSNSRISVARARARGGVERAQTLIFNIILPTPAHACVRLFEVREGYSKISTLLRLIDQGLGFEVAMNANQG